MVWHGIVWNGSVGQGEHRVGIEAHAQRCMLDGHRRSGGTATPRRDSVAIKRVTHFALKSLHNVVWQWHGVHHRPVHLRWARVGADVGVPCWPAMSVRCMLGHAPRGHVRSVGGSRCSAVIVELRRVCMCIGCMGAC